MHRFLLNNTQGHLKKFNQADGQGGCEMTGMYEVLAPTASLAELEQRMLECPQVDCPVNHHFSSGIYIREVTLPTGSLVMGHSHNQACMSILVKGTMLVVIDGVTQQLEAPMIFTTPKGRKLAYIVDEVVFQNVFPTDETDVAVLEAKLIDKSEAWTEHLMNETMLLSEAITHEG
jgi:hypothetical protein